MNQHPVLIIELVNFSLTLQTVAVGHVKYGRLLLKIKCLLVTLSVQIGVNVNAPVQTGSNLTHQSQQLSAAHM